MSPHLPSPTLIASLLKAPTLGKEEDEHREVPEMPGIRSVPSGVPPLAQTLHDSRPMHFTLMTMAQGKKTLFAKPFLLFVSKILLK